VACASGEKIIIAPSTVFEISSKIFEKSTSRRKDFPPRQKFQRRAREFSDYSLCLFACDLAAVDDPRKSLVLGIEFNQQGFFIKSKCRRG
jgi:hypothetical protein